MNKLRILQKIIVRALYGIPAKGDPIGVFDPDNLRICKTVFPDNTKSMSEWKPRMAINN